MAEHLRQLTSSSNTATGVSQWLLFSTLGMLHALKFYFSLTGNRRGPAVFFFLAGDWRSVPSTHNERLSTAEPPPMCIYSRPPTHFKK